MPTYHIHIKGIVQGVGFRPHVYRLAQHMDVKGWVNNTTDGVHIRATADENVLQQFYREIVLHPPGNARITHHHAKLVATQRFSEFSIQHSNGDRHPDLCITPDFGLCEDCRNELFDAANRRYRYPFITCTQCGPRYSIIAGLPYDRPLTTMEPYEQCRCCDAEFNDPLDRRYYSQTNSCDDCGIPMKLFNADGECLCTAYECILLMVQDALKAGHTLAVKGVGGYLLMCDATNALAVSALRERKHRPSKPLAVLYPDIKTAEKDVLLSAAEREALQSVTAPIVLCALKEEPATGVCTSIVAPGLNKLGVLLPYSPLLALIADGFKKPLVATSGNVSGSPILYTDDDALEGLGGIADFFLSYEREIVVPQDDSVIQFSKIHGQKIILRRSRGLAPNYFSSPFAAGTTALAMGAELKSSFALLDNGRCYVSQFLGDQSNYDAQQSYAHTLRHLTTLLRCEPEIILHDKHPDYFVTRAGKELAQHHHLPTLAVQHHKAHFAAVLAENNLLESDEPVLGVVWDGTGYGSDKQIWGGEFFLFADSEMSRAAHLDYFPLLAADKMAKEPRLSALALCADNAKATPLLREKFSAQEWSFYGQLLKKEGLQTSSAGRLLDGIAALLDVCNRSHYEGEAAMLLEARAASATECPKETYSVDINDGIVQWRDMLDELLDDLLTGIDRKTIAFKVHRSLAQTVLQLAQQSGVTRIAFSGGVLQNALLVDLLHDELEGYELFFHQQLSPNDECIGFGQLATLQLRQYAQSLTREKKTAILV